MTKCKGNRGKSNYAEKQRRSREPIQVGNETAGQHASQAAQPVQSIEYTHAVAAIGVAGTIGNRKKGTESQESPGYAPDATDQKQRIKPFDKTINENFQNWIFKQNAGQHNRFTQEQMDWLRMIKDHVVSSYHIDVDDLDYTPFDAQGGRGRMYQLFGKEMNEIINELNEVLAA